MLSVSIFNVARYLTDSLRGPVLAHYDEADRPSWYSERCLGFQKHQCKSAFLKTWKCFIWLDGRTGRTGYQKDALIFFILRYINYYTYIYKVIYICRFFIFWVPFLAIFGHSCPPENEPLFLTLFWDTCPNCTFLLKVLLHLGRTFFFRLHLGRTFFSSLHLGRTFFFPAALGPHISF